MKSSTTATNSPKPNRFSSALPKMLLDCVKSPKNEASSLSLLSDKEGEGSVFPKEIVEADVLITTPFHPGQFFPFAALCLVILVRSLCSLARDVIAKAKSLKLAIIAGVGSDHIDRRMKRRLRLLNNVVSVAEHVLLTILVLVKNYDVSHQQIVNGKWDVAEVAKGASELRGENYDYEQAAQKVGPRRVEDLKEFLSQCDVATLNCPLHEWSKGIMNTETLSWMKKGAWLVNTARGALFVAEDVAEAVSSGHLAGYGGDVWCPQPSPASHPWRTFKNTLTKGGNVMVLHYSGSSLDAQQRYANGTIDVLERCLDGKA
ncbi:hypothetical protein JCM11641_003273 [Rhodosporidiobolus odoratus]